MTVRFSDVVSMLIGIALGILIAAIAFGETMTRQAVLGIILGSFLTMFCQKYNE